MMAAADFAADEARRWFDEACRKGELLARITANVEAAQAGQLTAEQAITNVGALLADAERAGGAQ